MSLLTTVLLVGGTILSRDSLSVSPVPVPALGLCNSGELAANLLSLPARHQILDNILQQGDLSSRLIGAYNSTFPCMEATPNRTFPCMKPTILMPYRT